MLLLLNIKYNIRKQHKYFSTKEMNEKNSDWCWVSKNNVIKFKSKIIRIIKKYLQYIRELIRKQINKKLLDYLSFRLFSIISNITYNLNSTDSFQKY